MKEQIEKINPEKFGLEKSKVKVIEDAFTPKIIERDALAAIYKQLLTKEISEELCKEAGDLRKKLVKVRTGIAEIHRTQKAFFLAAGKFVDAWKKKETTPVIQMEDELHNIEKYFVIQEQKRIEDLQQERVNKILPYLEDATEHRFAEMRDDVWDAYYTVKKRQYDDRIAAEKKAAQDKIEEEKAEQKRREAIEKENKRLRNEAKAREDQAEAERLERIKADARVTEEKKRIAAKYEAKLDSERKEKARIENEAKAKTKKLQDELLAKEEAEAKRLKAIDDEKQAELNKGDAAKVKDLINDLRLVTEKYTFKSTKNKKMYAGVILLIRKIINFITNK